MKMIHSISLHSERPLINYSSDNDSTEEAPHLLLLSSLGFFSPHFSFWRELFSSSWPLFFFFFPLLHEERGKLKLVFSSPLVTKATEPS